MTYSIRTAGKVHDYETASAYLGSRQARPLCNNTKVERRSEKQIALRLHSTDILTYHDDGRTTFDTGGWNTVTTRQRMNECSDASVWTDNGVLYIKSGAPAWVENGERRVFKDGCHLYRGHIVGAGSPALATRTLKLRKDVLRFSREYVDRLSRGELDAPNGGDCWDCLLFDSKAKRGGKSHSATHIADHVKQKYYVPSLIVRAVETMGGSVALKDWIARRWKGSEAEANGFWRADDPWPKKQARTILRRYIYKSIGMAH